MSDHMSCEVKKGKLRLRFGSDFRCGLLQIFRLNDGIKEQEHDLSCDFTRFCCAGRGRG